MSLCPIHGHFDGEDGTCMKCLYPTRAELNDRCLSDASAAVRLAVGDVEAIRAQVRLIKGYVQCFVKACPDAGVARFEILLDEIDLDGLKRRLAGAYGSLAEINLEEAF